MSLLGLLRPRSRCTCHQPRRGDGGLLYRLFGWSKGTQTGLLVLGVCVASFILPHAGAQGARPADSGSAQDQDRATSTSRREARADGGSSRVTASLSANATAAGLLANRRLELTKIARADLEAGRVDGELIRLLDALLEHHRLTVSVFVTGHSKYVGNDPANEVSQHYYGQAADISKVDGGLVRAGHQPSRQVLVWLSRLEGDQRPTEVGSPFPEFDSGPGDGWFTDAAHWDHIHLGVRGRRR